MKILLTDIDDSLLFWRREFIDYATNTLKVVSHEWDRSKYALPEWLGISYKEAEKLIHGFTQTKKYTELDPYPTAVESVKKLHEAGWWFVGITSCSADPEVAKIRKQNLKNVFGDVFVAVHCLDPKADKTPLLYAYEPTFWVEDKAEWAEAGMKAGHTSFLIDQIHNQSYRCVDIKRVKTWKEINEHILNM